MQNGIAERWLGSARREMLDHIVPLNQSHLRRPGFEYLAYYQYRPNGMSQIDSQSRLGELHHRYGWTAAAYPHARRKDRCVVQRALHCSVLLSCVDPAYLLFGD